MKALIVLLLLAMHGIDYERGDPDYFIRHYFPMWRTWHGQGRAWVLKAFNLSGGSNEEADSNGRDRA